MKRIKREDLIVRESFAMFYGGGEIWFEQLDALSIHKDVVLDKLSRELPSIRKPSSPGLVAVNLNETLVDEEIATAIVDGLVGAGSAVSKVVFVGLDRTGKQLFRRRFKVSNARFPHEFINDYEKAKSWLVN